MYLICLPVFHCGLGNGRVSDSEFLEERNILEKKVVDLTKQVSTLEKRETR
jgi:hypothetical protein